MENINITFSGITDYLRDKDNEIDFYKKENIRYINRYDKLEERINKAVNHYLKELNRRGGADEVAVQMFNILEENK